MGIEYEALGPLRALVEGNEVAIPRPAQRRLLSILLLRTGADLRKDELIDLMWGENAPPTAGNTLQAHIAGLRRILGADCITTTKRGYALAVVDQPGDVTRFDGLCDRTDRELTDDRPDESLGAADAALTLWRGAPYPDIEDDEFARAEVRRLEERHAALHELRFAACRDMDRLQTCIPDLEAAMHTWPLRERLREFHMLALYQAGRQAEALRAFQDARRTLGEELGIEPGPDLTNLENRILLHDPTLVVAPATTGRMTNLEHELTSFVGRDQELQHVTQLLEGHRLVTLIGPGGTGKTRLAHRIGEDLLSSFAGGVWNVDLVPVGDPEQVPYRIAEALSVPEQPGIPIAETVRQYLEHRELLLIVDNCEHLLHTVAGIVHTLLSNCAALTILATSRERLGVHGEATWLVPPLGFPGMEETATYAVHHDAIDLFVDRVQTVDPNFHLDDENRADVAEICQRLDGMPLAIELAAVQANVLSPAEISQRIADRLPLVERRSRFRPARHTTLDAAIQWSFDLLDANERTLFCRLSVFAGRFTLDDAEVICSDDGLPPSQVLDLLARLVDKSLVIAHTAGGGSSRYGLMETVRFYASQRQLESDDPVDIALRHSHRFVALAETAEVELRSGHQPGYLDRLEADHDNLRSAFDWLVTTGRIEAALRMGTALRWFWKMRDHVSEGSDRLERALDQDRGVPATVRARALMASGILRSSGDTARAYPLLEESQELAASCGDALCQGLALGWLGLLDRMGDRLESSKTRLTGALTLLETTQERWAIAFALGHLGVLAREMGNLDEAAGYHERALRIDRETENGQDEAWNLAGLGLVHLYQGDYERARVLLDRSLIVHRDLGFDFETASMTILLAVSAIRSGMTEDTARYLAEAADLANRLGSARLLDATYRAQASVALDNGEPKRAVQLLGTAEHIRSVNGLSRSMFQALFENDEAQLHTMLAPADFDAAWQSGRSVGEATLQTS